MTNTLPPSTDLPPALERAALLETIRDELESLSLDALKRIVKVAGISRHEAEVYDDYDNKVNP